MPLNLRAAEALAAPVRMFAGWHLLAHCGTCRLLRQIDVTALPPRGTMGETITYQRCRSRPASVTLENHASGTEAGSEQVVVKLR